MVSVSRSYPTCATSHGLILANCKTVARTFWGEQRHNDGPRSFHCHCKEALHCKDSHCKEATVKKPL